jgi:glycosyltransferase involved in cell wall biosynthesis
VARSPTRASRSHRTRPHTLTTRPRVVINARAAARTQIGGVERLAREMSARLPLLRPERYRVIRPLPALAHRAGHLWEQVALPVMAGRTALIYSPANLAPVVSPRNVVVIHDVAALRHPESFSKMYVSYQRVMLPLVARRARRLITVSEFSKRELIDVLDVAPEAVEVVPDGVDERFRPGADPAPAGRAHNLHGPYVLVVGTLSGRKNLEALVPVQRALSREGVELVVAGSERGYLPAPRLTLRRLGYVAESQLPGLYAGARAVVMPSLYEGFGLPCLEAMACGTPVVCSPFGALPEICGEAALVVDPGNSEAFADAVLRSARDEELRARLSEAGRARAQGYSWDRTAERTDAVLSAALARL